MALIKCSECGKEISDRAIACPNCGCPIEKEKAEGICSINGNSYNLLEELELVRSGVEGTEVALKICSKCNISIKDAIGLCAILEKEDRVPETYSCINIMPECKPHCPTCGSANIRRISTTAKVAGAVAFGLFSKTAKSQFECKSCGCKW